MENNEQMVENQNSGTPTEQVQVDVKPTSNEVESTSFTQEQVNGIVRDRLNRIYERYGVKDSKELDNLIGKTQAYDVMKKRITRYREQLNGLNEEMAFMKNDIEPTRYDDVRAYFKGKGIKFNIEALANELANHPEWKRVIEKSNNKVTTINAISPDRNIAKTSTNEKDEVAKLFGFKNGFVR